MANGNIQGEKLYQKRAREALPLLVRQAELRREISYLGLAQELKMSNARNLNHVLECVGLRLEQLAKDWGEDIPRIQTMVVNGDTGLPSEGIGWLYEGEERSKFDALPISERRHQLSKVWAGIYDYKKWPEVLDAVGLKPFESRARGIAAATAKLGATGESRGASFGSGGEGPAHKRLKEYVAGHPEVVYLTVKGGPGSMEVALSSGDRLDVQFIRGQDRIAVEVKSAESSLPDIARGIFQCVKYCAVIEAEQASQDLPRSARAVLVLGGRLPEELIGLRNRLGVEVIERAVPVMQNSEL